MIPDRLKHFFRPTSTRPAGAIVHDGDCAFFSYSICDCGLLHEMRCQPEDIITELYPEFAEEDSDHQWTLGWLLESLRFELQEED